MTLDAEHRAATSYEARRHRGLRRRREAELARFDRSRKDRKTSNKEWHPQDPDAKIAKMKDGRTSGGIDLTAILR